MISPLLLVVIYFYMQLYEEMFVNGCVTSRTASFIFSIREVQVFSQFSINRYVRDKYNSSDPILSKSVRNRASEYPEIFV